MSKFSNNFRKACSKGDYERDKDLPIPDNVTIFKDIKYGRGRKYNLLDVYYPNNTNQKIPVIVSVHGGAYVYGLKEVYFKYCLFLASQGFAVVNFNYHLAPEYKFPTQIEEINQVMQWVCQNSDKYYLDLNNVFIVGDSAGAQLASHYACIYSNKEFEKLFSFNVPKELKVRAVGLNCGRYEMESFFANRKPKVHLEHFASIGQDLVDDYFGKDPDKFFEMAQVVDNITKDFPPSYILTGYYDYLKNDAKPMYDYLTKLNIEAQYKVYGDETTTYMCHDFHANMNLKEAKQANIEELEFFRKHINN